MSRTTDFELHDQEVKARKARVWKARVWKARVRKARVWKARGWKARVWKTRVWDVRAQEAGPGRERPLNVTATSVICLFICEGVSELRGTRGRVRRWEYDTGSGVP